MRTRWWLALGMVAFGLLAWLWTPPTTQRAGRLRVVTTTDLIADVVRQVAGDAVEVRALLPPNVDAHTFWPAPRDIAAALQADLVFVNGFGLERAFLDVLGDAAPQAIPISVSEGIVPRTLGGHDGGADPHVWLDPANVARWAQNVARHLSQADPAHAAQYAANARAYEAQLGELDAWVQAQVARLPQPRRLVTDHDVFGYYAARYGFELVGAIAPGLSTAVEPSAQALAALQQAIGGLGVRAVFVGTTVNPALAQRMADDAGVQLVVVYTGSLSAPDGPAATYLNYMRYNTRAIVGALGKGAP